MMKELENEDPDIELSIPKDRSEDGAIADAIKNKIANTIWTNYLAHQQENEFDMEDQMLILVKYFIEINYEQQSPRYKNKV